MQIIMATVRPMKRGAKASPGRPTLQPSVKEKIRKTRANVPMDSTQNALKVLTDAIGPAFGFGKNSPNIMAVLTDSGVPRTIPFIDSYDAMEAEKSK